jgi:hypothetical protein
MSSRIASLLKGQQLWSISQSMGADLQKAVCNVFLHCQRIHVDWVALQYV